MNQSELFILKAYRRAKQRREWRRRFSMVAFQLRLRLRAFGALLLESITGPALFGLLYGTLLVFIAGEVVSVAIGGIKRDVHLIKQAVAQGDLCPRGTSSTEVRAAPFAESGGDGQMSAAETC